MTEKHVACGIRFWPPPNNPPKICKVCGKSFSTEHRTVKTCSPECGYELKLRRQRLNRARGSHE